MTIKQRAILFFTCDLVIASAAAFQVGVAVRYDRPGLALVGILCAGVATFCCAVNWSIWHRQTPGA